MMSFECFEMLMNTAKSFWNKINELEEFLNVQFDDNWMTNHFADIIDSITTEFEGPDPDNIDDDIGPIIMYWMFDMDCGEEKNIIPYKGIDYEVNNLNDLYNILNLIKIKREEEKI